MQRQQQNKENKSELGKQSTYDGHYNPTRLYPIPRAEKREEIDIAPNAIPFYGFDAWNHYEVSWLNHKGKPIVAVAEIVYDCHSPNIIESKSLKLYFNSLNNTKFSSAKEVSSVIKKDLEKMLISQVDVKLHPLHTITHLALATSLHGESIDDLDIDCSTYQVAPTFLSTDNKIVKECLYSDLLKSNCLVTGQPDWGSVQIIYKGKKINREGLLRYIVSFRDHHEFHEQCIERIYMDITRYCEPLELTVYGRYTRRGGLDINPCRSSKPIDHTPYHIRLIRQ